MARSEINKQGIREFTRDLQREFDKNQIRIPIEVDNGGLPSGDRFGNATIYNGPVFHGDINGNAQIAWANENVVQNQTQDVTRGFEDVARVVTKIVRQLPIGLGDDDLQVAHEAGENVLAEVVRPEPDRSKIRRALATIKGVLAPVGSGMVAGVEEGVQEFATAAFTELQNLVF